MKYHLKAYTLLETTLSMVIMSVIVIIVYTLLSSFLNQFRFYTETKDKTLEYILFKTNLKNEFYNSKEVLEEFKGIKIMRNDLVEVQYKFYDSFILREIKETAIDTFFVNVKNYKIILTSEGTKKYVAKLSLQLAMLEERFDLVLKKEYGAHIYVNNDFKEWK